MFLASQEKNWTPLIEFIRGRVVEKLKSDTRQIRRASGERTAIWSAPGWIDRPDGGQGEKMGTDKRTEVDYETVIGLEVHAQLRTQSKLFSDAPVLADAAPNSAVSPLCLALPGALPVLNEAAVTLALRACLALGCQVHEHSVFARKNYFLSPICRRAIRFRNSKSRWRRAALWRLKWKAKRGRRGATPGRCA